MVREVAIDRRAIFLVSTSQQGPEMYEIVCDSPEEKKRLVEAPTFTQLTVVFLIAVSGLMIFVLCVFRWMDIIREAAANAPEDDSK